MSIDQKLGDYELLERIGKGGQGEIYKAFDTNLKRLVAIKIFHAPDEKRRKKVAHFKYEARLASAINHTNICTVYSLFEHNSKTCLVMEYVEGKNLFEIAFGHPLELKSALKIIIQITEALVVAHSQSIIHRDIKPRNVMVTPEGRAVLLDFGLAKLLQEEDENFEFDADEILSDARASEIFFEDIAENLFQTVDGLPFGTPSSSPPEMAQGKKTDERGDVFAVGGVLYLLLTGTYAFRGNTIKEVRHKVINEEPVPVNLARKEGKPIPPELIAIVNRALQKNPDERFQTMSGMRDELISVLQSLENSESLPNQPPVFTDLNKLSYASSPSRHFWQKPSLVLSIGVFLIAVILLVWYIFF